MTTNKLSVSIRLSADVKAIATDRAAAQNRSLASYVEWLIIQDAQETEHLLSSPANAERLMASVRQIKASKQRGGD